MRVSLKVSGMSCVNCAKAIEISLKKLKGVEEVHVSFELGRVVVSFKEDLLDVEQIKGVIESLGYKVERVEGGTKYMQILTLCWISSIAIMALMLWHNPYSPYFQLVLAFLVQAIDVEPLAVEYAKKKVESLGLSNVEVYLSEENHIPLPDNAVDFVFMAFVFHELENPVAFMEEVKRVCKPLAYVGIVDWKKEERDKGPPPEEVYSEWELGLMLEEAGLKLGRVVELSKYCFGAYAMVIKEEPERFQSPIKIPPGLV